MWALGVTEALRRPDLGALVLAAGAKAGTAFESTWDAWTQRVFGEAMASPVAFPPEPPRWRMPEAGEERIHPVDGSVMVFVPGGVFLQGADDANQAARPVHEVTLRPYWIDKYPVTNSRYARFLRANPSVQRPEYWDNADFNGPEQPVVGVSWDEAMAYAMWAGLALPSEAQWEAAARGRDGRRYPWGNEPPDAQRANFGREVGRTTPVGAYPAGAGPYGTLDQAGNVDEWCLDPWNARAYEARRPDLADPVAEGNTAGRAVRGGSWAGDPGFLAAAIRFGLGTGFRLQFQGFRCVLSWSPPSTVGS